MEVDSGTPSLLERIGESRRGAGRLAGARRSAAPYQKRRGALGTSSADTEGMWKHDRHEEVAGGPLAARLHNREARPRPDTSLVTKALGFKAQPQPSLSIKGASEADERVIEVKGLVAGTSADDVKAIFQSCGPIIKTWTASNLPSSPVVYLQYGKREDAGNAIEQFNGQIADGSKLSVAYFAATPKTVEEKVMSTDKNVDLLASDSARSGKMYSDIIMETDPRSQVLTGDFNPPDTSARGGRAWRGRRGRGGRRGGMDVDR